MCKMQSTENETDKGIIQVNDLGQIPKAALRIVHFDTQPIFGNNFKV